MAEPHMTAHVPTLEDSLTFDERGSDLYVDGLGTFRGSADYEEHVRDAKRHLVEVYEEVEIPIPYDDITIAIANSLGVASACVSPYGCGEYRYYKRPHKHWEVEKQPSGYVIYISDQKVGDPDPENPFSLGTPMRQCVRHELAHAINWHVDGVTYEGQNNHREWLNRLGTR